MTNWQLADCNRQINCNHQSPKTEFPLGLKDCMTSNTCDILKLKNKKIFIYFLFVYWYNYFMHCAEMNDFSIPHENYTFGP